MSTPSAVIINQTYPAVAHFAPEAEATFFVETIGTVLVFSEMGIQPTGSAPVTFTHDQSIAADQWIINHNLGYTPASVRLLTPGGVEMIAAIIDVSVNQAVANFSSPVAGRAVVT